jgi:hypothetical protein
MMIWQAGLVLGVRSPRDENEGKTATRRVPGSHPAYLDEHTTEQRGREETMLRHAWFDPSASGRLNQKVEPRPGALWTPTCP